MVYRSVQLVLALYPGYPLSGKSFGTLLLLIGIGSFLTGTRYGKPNYLKSRREARREKLIGRSGMRELYLALGHSLHPLRGGGLALLVSKVAFLSTTRIFVRKEDPMQRSGLGKKVAGLLPALLCIGWGVVVSVPHTSPYARTATFVLAALGAVYWLATGLMQAREQRSAWYKQSRILVGLAYLLALPAFWLFAAAPMNAAPITLVGEIGLFLTVIVLVVMASYARRESGSGPVERRRGSLFTRKTPPFREQHMKKEPGLFRRDDSLRREEGALAMKRCICRIPFLIPLLVLCLLCAGCLGSAPPKPGMITEYALPPGASDPYAITSGPDGNIWFGATNVIGRITPQGKITEFALPTSPSGPAEVLPANLTVGPDKALWFIDEEEIMIGRITSAGTITEFTSPVLNSSPLDLTVGPDGNLWFPFKNAIGHITPRGVISSFLLPTPEIYPSGLVTGSDGALWFTEPHAGKIGRITLTGKITEFIIPTANSNPGALALGPDGALWFTEGDGGKIGRIIPRGSITEFDVPGAISEGLFGMISGPGHSLWFIDDHFPPHIGRITPQGQISEFGSRNLYYLPSHFIVGPDGNLWFIVQKGNSLGRITPTGVISVFAVPTPESSPLFLTTGPGGTIWFTEQLGNKIARFTPPKPSAA